MHKYRQYIKRDWHLFVLAALLKMAEACGEFILPYLNANIINIGAANADMQYILRTGGWMLALALGMMATGVSSSFFAVRASSRLAAGVRSDTFRKIQTFSFSEIDTFTTGSLITRMTNDLTQIQNFVLALLRTTFRSPIMIIGAIVMSFTLNPSLALIIIAMVPILGAVIAAVIVIASPRYNRMQKQIDELNVDVRETVTNERVIKSFVREDHERRKFAKVNENLVDKSIAALKMMIIIQPASALAINVTTLLVVWVSGRQIMVGGMEIGTLTAFITYLSQVLTALNMVANLILNGTRASASDRRITEVLAAQVKLDDSLVEDPGREVKSGEISFRNVTYRYFKHNEERVLSDINIDIKSGQYVGLIGSTGCGKTTLVSLISRLYDADSGTILIDGEDIRKIPLAHLRQSIAVVLQKNTLFSGTIAENLRWGNPDATDDEVREAARIAQADGFISTFPAGYDTELVQGGQNLSGGQKQRVCIARALLKKPRILILDDSTSAVDTATDAAIRAGLRSYMPQATKIVIAQRINTVKDADQIIVMDAGKVVGCGTHDQLMQTCPEYQEIYWSQNDREVF